MEEKVERDVDDAAVEEDGDNKTPPLVWSWAVGKFLARCEVEVDVWDATEAAELAESTGVVCRICGGGVGTGPGDWQLFGVLYAVHVVHAGLVAGAHVDVEIWRGSDHGIERRFELDWRAREHS